MRRSLSFFLVLLAIAGALVFWQSRARRAGRISTPASLTFSALRPGQKIVFSVGGWFSDVGRVMFRRNDLASENTALRARLVDVEGQNLRLRRYERENKELQSLLNMSKPEGGTPIAAQIVSFDVTDYTQRIFINVNQRQGARAKDVVYTSHGVVGQIETADYKFLPIPTSEVLLLTDSRSGVGARIARSGAVGVAQGTGGALCKLDYLDFHADVREGDTVLTSGLVVQSGGVFPKGLVIGRVIKVQRDKTLSRLTAFVDPAVPFDQITSVLVRAGANK